jgi:type 1 fimbria pilin
MATQCTGTVTFRLPALNANRYAAQVGAPISSWGTRNGSGVNCGQTSGDLIGWHLGELSMTMPARVRTYTESGVVYDVFPTNIAGIGYVVGYRRYGAGSAAPSIPCDGAWRPLLAGPAPEASLPFMPREPCTVMGTRQNAMGGGVQTGGSTRMINFMYTVRVRFIRTGADLGSGSIDAASFGSVCYHEYLNENSLAQGRPPFNLAQGTCMGAPASTGGTVPAPVAPTCQITGGLNRTIRMDAASLGSYRGVGSTAVPTPFQIRMSCRNTTRLTYRFDGQTEYLPSVLRNLGASQPSGGAAAQGIGVQLLDAANNPVNIGTTYPVTGNVNMPLTLGFILRYMFIAEARQLRAGDVTVRTTITVNYE